MSQVIGDLTLSFVGTPIQGDEGNPGKSAYQSYLDTTTDNPVLSEVDWVDSLGKEGQPGKSTYQSYLDTTSDNPKKTEAQWVASLKGEKGDSVKGNPGKSSYQSYLDTTSDNPKLSEAQWVASLKGADGKDGTGLTNRQAWVTGSTYSPGDYVFSDNENGDNSMWILSGTEDYVSNVAPKDDLTHWIEFQAPAGANGVGVSGMVVEYQGATSGTVIPTGSWVTAVPVVTKGQFLWTRVTFTLTDNSTTATYSVAYQGADGTNGKGISATATTYQAGANGTTAPTGTWTTTVPVVTKGQYLWTRNVFTYTDASTATAYSVAYSPLDGTNGVGVSSVVVTYQAGTSGTVAPTGAWVTDVPTVAQGQFLWTRTVTTLSSAATATAYSVAYFAVDGTGGGTGGGTTWLNGNVDPTGSTGAAGNYYQNTSTYVVWYRATTTWAAIGVIMPIASTTQAKDALSNLVLMTPARVREYMEKFGLTATFTAQATDLNLIVNGSFFNYSGAATGGTAHIPAAGTYGRGICIPSGDGYATQLAIENDSGKVYVRYQTAGTWDATWKLVGPTASSGGGGGGTTVYTTVQTAQKGLSTASATPLAMTFGSAGTPPGDATTAVLYRMTGTLLTQGPTDTAAVFSIKFTGGTEGANLFRMIVRSADATGAVKQVVSNQDSLAINATSFGDNMVTIEGIVQLNYVNPTGIDLSCQLVSGAWSNILAGSHLTFTPLGKVITA